LKQLRCVIIKIPNDEGSWLCLVLPNLKRFEEDKLFYDEDMGAIWWGIFQRGGHNMPCPHTFFSLDCVFREVSKIKVIQKIKQNLV